MDEISNAGPQPRESGPLWDCGSAAARLSVPERWLRQEIEAGRIPALCIGKCFYVDVDYVERLLVQRARTEFRARQ